MSKTFRLPLLPLLAPDEIFQKQIEEKIFTNQNRFEASALKSYSKQRLTDAMSQLNDFQQSTSEDVVTAWWDFFWDVVVSKYRDIYKYATPLPFLSH